MNHNNHARAPRNLGEAIVLSPTDDTYTGEEIAAFMRELHDWWPNRPLGVGIKGGTGILRWLADNFERMQIVQYGTTVQGPERPPEPMGFGAVVIDIKGHPWVRVCSGHEMGLGRAWAPLGSVGTHEDWLPYRNVAAVAVKSEGADL